MRIKRTGKKIFGAELTADERRAMDIEIKRQLAEFDKKHEREIDALVLYILCTEFGFGKKRCKRFYDALAREMAALSERYQLENDEVWLCTKKLRERGINIDEW